MKVVTFFATFHPISQKQHLRTDNSFGRKMGKWTFRHELCLKVPYAPIMFFEATLDIFMIRHSSIITMEENHICQFPNHSRLWVKFVWLDSHKSWVLNLYLDSHPLIKQGYLHLSELNLAWLITQDYQTDI